MPSASESTSLLVPGEREKKGLDASENPLATPAATSEALPVTTKAAPLSWLRKVLARQDTKGAVRMGGDLLAVNGAFYFTFLIIGAWLDLGDQLGLHSQNLLLLMPLLVVVTELLNGYKNLDYLRPERELEITLKSMTLSFLLLFATNFVAFKTLLFSRYFMLTWYLLSLLAVPLMRAAVREGFHLLWEQGVGQQPAVLVASPSLAQKIQTVLRIQRHCYWQLVGYIYAGPADERENPLRLPRLGSIADWNQILCGVQANLLILALEDFSPKTHETVLEITRWCRQRGYQVVVASELFNLGNSNWELDEFSGFFVLSKQEASASVSVQRMLKRCMDVGMGLLGSVYALLLLPLVALAIKLEDGGPIFFRQEYLASRGRRRYYWKFRSMKVNAAEILEKDLELRKRFDQNFKLEDDPRITRVGRFLRKYSIDEFPEFFSVLKGDLSFVGPRTISSQEASRYGDHLEKLLSVKPGLTGYWQVTGRQRNPYEDRVVMDMFYIDRWSIWMDLVIIFKTFMKVVSAEGAY